MIKAKIKQKVVLGFVTWKTWRALTKMCACYIITELVCQQTDRLLR